MTDPFTGTPLIVGIIALGVAVFVLMIIVGIIMFYYCRDTMACSFLERCFKRTPSALNNLADSSYSYQPHTRTGSFDTGGDYVENIANTVTNPAQFVVPFVSNVKKPNNITKDINRAGRTYDRTNGFREIYQKTMDPVQTQPSDSIYDRMINQNEMYDVTYQTRSKFQDSTYNHAKELNETYDITHQRNREAFGANTYDSTRNIAGSCRR